MKKVFTLLILLFSLHLFAATIEENVMLSLDTVTVKLHSKGNQQYLTTKIEVEVTNQKSPLELTGKKQALRDDIIRIISSKTSNDISTVQGKERLKEQIATELNKHTKYGKIIHVYFSDYAIE